MSLRERESEYARARNSFSDFFLYFMLATSCCGLSNENFIGVFVRRLLNCSVLFEISIVDNIRNISRKECKDTNFFFLTESHKKILFFRLLEGRKIVGETSHSTLSSLDQNPRTSSFVDNELMFFFHANLSFTE